MMGLLTTSVRLKPPVARQQRHLTPGFYDGQDKVHFSAGVSFSDTILPTVTEEYSLHLGPNAVPCAPKNALSQNLTTVSPFDGAASKRSGKGKARSLRLPKLACLLAAAVGLFMPTGVGMADNKIQVANAPRATLTVKESPVPVKLGPFQFNLPQVQVDVNLGIPQLKQKPWACVTTSLSMVLRHFNMTVSPDELDLELHRVPDNGLNPSVLKDSAERRGLVARHYNNSTFDEIRQHIQSGHPMIAWVDVGSNQEGQYLNSFHVVVISGYRVLSDGQQFLEIIDPTPDAKTGQQVRYEEYNEFTRKFWGDLAVEDSEYDEYIPLGFNRLIIAFSPDEQNMPPERFGGLAKQTDAEWAKGVQVRWNNYLALPAKQLLTTK